MPAGSICALTAGGLHVGAQYATQTASPLDADAKAASAATRAAAKTYSEPIVVRCMQSGDYLVDLSTHLVFTGERKWSAHELSISKL
jgi:hypothetical protein